MSSLLSTPVFRKPRIFSALLQGGKTSKRHEELVRRNKRHVKTSGGRQGNTHSTTHFSFMTLALKPRTANTTNVARMEVTKLMTDTSAASKWQLLSRLL